MHLASFFWLGGTRKWPILSLFSFYVSVLLACSSDIFCGCANVFSRESTMLKLQKRGKSKGGGRGWGEGRENACLFFFSPPPPPFPSFSLAPTPLYLKAAISTLPNVPLSLNRRWQLKQYKHKQAFARPKYTCSAGYCFTDCLNLCYRGVDWTWASFLIFTFPHSDFFLMLALQPSWKIALLYKLIILLLL